MQAAQERTVVHPSPAEHSVEVLRQRLLRDAHAGHIMSQRTAGITAIKRKKTKVRIRIETTRVPLDQALPQVHRPPGLTGIPQRDRVLDRIPRVRIIARGNNSSNSKARRAPPAATSTSGTGTAPSTSPQYSSPGDPPPPIEQL